METKIMIVDDDTDVLALMKMKLEKTGRFTVFTMSDGSKAVAAAVSESPNLIILDIDMPIMTGGEIAETLADDDRTAAIPVVFFSSLIPKSEAAQGPKVIGGRTMVSKYTPIPKLIEVIDSLV